MQATLKKLAIAAPAILGIGLFDLASAPAQAGDGDWARRARRIVNLVNGLRHGRHGHGHGHGLGHGHGHGHGGHIILPIRNYHVVYHMHGTRTLHYHSHAAAHRAADRLESLGIHATVRHGHGFYDVVYHMHGQGSRRFSSHFSAHRFERSLERLGIHARVVHH